MKNAVGTAMVWTAQNTVLPLKLCPGRLDPSTVTTGRGTPQICLQPPPVAGGCCDAPDSLPGWDRSWAAELACVVGGARSTSVSFDINLCIGSGAYLSPTSIDRGTNSWWANIVPI